MFLFWLLFFSFFVFVDFFFTIATLNIFWMDATAHIIILPQMCAFFFCMFKHMCEISNCMVQHYNYVVFSLLSGVVVCHIILQNWSSFFFHRASWARLWRISWVWSVDLFVCRTWTSWDRCSRRFTTSPLTLWAQPSLLRLTTPQTIRSLFHPTQSLHPLTHSLFPLTQHRSLQFSQRRLTPRSLALSPLTPLLWLIPLTPSPPLPVSPLKA